MEVSKLPIKNVRQVQLHCIADRVQSWIDCDKKFRTEQSLDAGDDTKLINPPDFPSRDELEEWIKALKGLPSKLMFDRNERILGLIINGDTFRDAGIKENVSTTTARLILWKTLNAIVKNERNRNNYIPADFYNCIDAVRRNADFWLQMIKTKTPE